MVGLVNVQNMAWGSICCVLKKIETQEPQTSQCLRLLKHVAKIVSMRLWVSILYFVPMLAYMQGQVTYYTIYYTIFISLSCQQKTQRSLFKLQKHGYLTKKFTIHKQKDYMSFWTSDVDYNPRYHHQKLELVQQH